MTRRVISIVADDQELSFAAAERFTQVLSERLQQPGHATVALSGGSTPQRLFQLLAEKPYRDRIDWSRLEVFWGDERTVPPDSPECNFGMTEEFLLSRVPVPEQQIHRMRGEIDPRQAATEYERVLREVFDLKPGEVPRFDLQLLGIGADGHTASLFPDTAALDERDRLCVANPVPGLETTRLTLTAKVINASHNILILASGPNKAEAVARAIEGDWDPVETPSQILRGARGAVYWILDEAAAARLSTPTREHAL